MQYTFVQKKLFIKCWWNWVTLWVDSINIRAQLFCAHRMRGSFWHSICWTANKFGKKCTNLSLKFGVLIVGEIEWWFFLPNSVRRQLFAWGKKFGEIDFLPSTSHAFPPSLFFISLSHYISSSSCPIHHYVSRSECPLKI